MLSFSFFCVCAIVPVFLHMANPFVALWIGQQYCISLFPLIMFGIILADNLIMPVIYAARDAKGLYRESKNYAIAQAVVNVVLSIALVIPFGIMGVLAGTFAALYLILQPSNFHLVYTKVFKRKTTIYLSISLVVAFICVISYFRFWIRDRLFSSRGHGLGDVYSENAYMHCNCGWVSFHRAVDFQQRLSDAYQTIFRKTQKIPGEN